MIKFDVLICGEKVSQQVGTDQLSITNIIQEIVTESFPVNLSQLFVLLIMSRELTDPDTIEVEFFIFQNKIETVKARLSIAFEGKEISNTIVGWGGLTISENTMVTFRVSYDAITPIEYKFSVKGRESAIPQPQFMK